MPIINMKVTYADGTESTVTAGPKQQIAFEKHRKKGLGSAFSGGDLYVEDLYWLAWKADTDARVKAGQTAQLFDAWLDEIADVEASGGADPNL